MEVYQEITDQDRSNFFLDIEEEEKKEMLSAAITQSSVGILMTDLEGVIIYANNANEKISGYKISELVGKESRIIKTGLIKDETYVSIKKTLATGSVWSGEQINQRKDGTIYHEEWRITPIYNKDGELKHYLIVKYDISERIELEQKLKEVAMRDCLTDSFNRAYFMERLNQMSDNYKRIRKEFSLIILDIDHFKKVNDEHGHLAGDIVLVQLVEIINREIRSYDILGRYGGEEFIIGLPDTTGGEAYILIDRILNIIRKKIFIYDGNNIQITFSAGVVGSSEIDINELSAESLISLADDRLYMAKEIGRNKIVK